MEEDVDENDVNNNLFFSLYVKPICTNLLMKQITQKKLRRRQVKILTMLNQLEQVSRGSRIPPASVTALYIK